MFLLSLLVKCSGKVKTILLGLGALLIAAALFVMPNTSKLLLCLAGGILMPCIAAAGLNRWLWETDRRKGESPKTGRLIAEAVIVTVVLFLISFVGSLFTAASLSESAFMLEMSMYRGVKLMQLVPLMIFVISCVQIFVFERYIFTALPEEAAMSRHERRMRHRSQWNDFLDRPVKLRGVYYGGIAVVAVLFLMLLGVYYMIRTGNMNNEMVPSMEIQIRNFLEEALAARPRTKEWLIGYPCMMLMVWAYRRRVPGLPWLFGLGAVIGFTSIVNTFLHIRTMLAVSFARVMIGLSFGIVVGLIAVIVCEIIYRLIMKHRNAIHS